jgi:hypothetical protein
MVGRCRERGPSLWHTPAFLTSDAESRGAGAGALRTNQPASTPNEERLACSRAHNGPGPILRPMHNHLYSLATMIPYPPCPSIHPCSLLAPSHLLP